ncbi:MAG: class I SAM-dependent methyltransferase [Candidatus Bathyarchaeota archaeon]|nr:class I SAM-dependent methyltransferase [Candidatus Bathyarchaeota archaeon]
MPTPTVFEETASYWTEIADANHTAEQVSFTKKALPAEGTVLDLACCTGRHLIELCKSGYPVVGLDFSRRLLHIAQDKAADAGVTAWLVRADMRFLPFRSASFGSTISLDSSIGYLPSEEAELQSLNEVARTLRNRGAFLVDVFNGARIAKRHRQNYDLGLRWLILGLLPRFPLLAALFKWRDYPSFRLLQKRSVVDAETKLRDLWVFQNKQTGKITIHQHVIRLYSSSKLADMLGKAGFGALRFYGDYTGQEYRKDSRRLAVVAEKQENLKA